MRVWDFAQRRRHIGSDRYLVTELFQIQLHVPHGILMILDQKNTERTHSLNYFSTTFSCVPDSSARRRRTVNAAPRSFPSLRTAITPPCASTIAFEIAKPKPKPPNRFTTSLSPCSNGTKI